MSRWSLSWLLGFVAVGLVGLSMTYSAPGRDVSLEKKHDNIKLLIDVLEEVQAKYVKELDQDKMRELVEAMINNGLGQFDQHSYFYNKQEYSSFMQQSKGRFGGIGIRIGLDPGTGAVRVESPMVGTPAYEAGLMAGDLILKVDGHSLENANLKKVVDLIQGEPGSKVTLSVLHEGQKKPVDVDIVRAEIHVDSVLGDRRHPTNLKDWDFWIDQRLKIAYVRVAAFTETTTAELTKVIDGLRKAGMKGLVIDLRGNPGGLLRSAVETSSLFLPEGKHVVTTKGRNHKQESYEAKVDAPGFPITDMPIAVLINRYSASASEILAAALQDHFRAIIVGERSYGKGSVQNVIMMQGGESALKLTTASYWRPSEKNIHRFPDSKETDEWGVKPNKGYEVKLDDQERIDFYKWRRARDIVLRPGQDTKLDDEPKLKNFKDRVLEKALEYVRGELSKGKQAEAGAALRPAETLAPPALPVEPALAEVGRDRSGLRPARALDPGRLHR